MTRSPFAHVVSEGERRAFVAGAHKMRERVLELLRAHWVRGNSLIGDALEIECMIRLIAIESLQDALRGDGS